MQRGKYFFTSYFRLVFFVLLLLLLKGCILLPIEYYLPSSEGGRLVRLKCGVVKDLKIYQLDEAQIAVRLGLYPKYIGTAEFEDVYPVHDLKNEDFEQQLGISIVAKVPEGSSFRITKNVFMIKVNGGNEAPYQLGEFKYLSPNPPYDFLIEHPLSMLAGKTLSRGLFAPKRSLEYRSHIWLKTQEIQTLLLSFPKIKVNNSAYQLEQASFRELKKYALHPFNC